MLAMRQGHFLILYFFPEILSMYIPFLDHPLSPFGLRAVAFFFIQGSFIRQPRSGFILFFDYFAVLFNPFGLLIGLVRFAFSLLKLTKDICVAMSLVKIIQSCQIQLFLFPLLQVILQPHFLGLPLLLKVFLFERGYLLQIHRLIDFLNFVLESCELLFLLVLLFFLEFLFHLLIFRLLLFVVLIEFDKLSLALSPSFLSLLYLFNPLFNTLPSFLPHATVFARALQFLFLLIQPSKISFKPGPALFLLLLKPTQMLSNRCLFLWIVSMIKHHLLCLTFVLIDELLQILLHLYCGCLYTVNHLKLFVLFHMWIYFGLLLGNLYVLLWGLGLILRSVLCGLRVVLLDEDSAQRIMLFVINLQSDHQIITMSQSTINLLQPQKQSFVLSFEQLSQQMHATSALLEEYYHQAYEQLDTGKFIVNTSIVKELRMYLSQIAKIAKLAGSGTNLFLLSINSLHQHEQEEDTDIDKYIDKYRDQTELPLRRWNLEDKYISKIKTRCSAVTSLTLISNPLSLQQMINDSDLPRLKTFAKISRLSLKSSNISDTALFTINELFQNLKEIDISGCRMISNEGVKSLLGYKYVSIKMNGCEGVTQRAILSLVSTSYNLNYFQVSHIKHCNYKDMLEQISTIYSNNKINFKWLQVVCNLGTNLFLNKLSYLTHLTNAENITDREVEILLGDQPTIDGLYFNCCQQLHSDTVGYIIEHCSKLKRLSLRRFLNLTDALVGDVVSKLIRLQCFSLNECYELTSKSLIQVANQLRKLKEINLTKCPNIEDEGLMYLIQKMPSLISINLSSCKNITDRVVYHIANHLPNLTSLNLERCDQITNQSLLYLSQKLILLQQLILNYCEHLNDDSLCLVAMRQRKLKRLQIQWCQVTQKCISFIAQNLNQLETVNFNYCPSVCDQSFHSLSKHAIKLQVLKLQSCDKLTTRAFSKLFGALKRLRHLDLKQCIGVNDAAIEQLCNGSRGELTHLDLSWCSQITDKGMLSLSQFQPQILFLNLNGCSNVSDSAIGWLCTTMTQLQYLNLTLCEKLTDLSIIQISKNLFALRNLYLCDLRSLTDSSVSLLANIPNLQELHLSGCIQISSSSLIALLHNLEKLQCLNISQCSNIFTQSLYFLVERMRNLKKFSIASLEVDDKLLGMVGEHMQRLQWINLQYCRNLSDSAVIRMMQKIPCLIKIELQNTQISEKSKQIIFEELSSRSAHYMPSL